MSELVEKSTESLKETLKSLKVSCLLMDIAQHGTKKYFPDKSTEDVLKLNLYSFLLYIAAADGTISTAEAEVINRAMDSSYTVEDYRQLAEKAKVDEPAFSEEVPLFLRAAVEFDNQMTEQKTAEETQNTISVCRQAYSLFIIGGLVAMMADEVIHQSEYDRLMDYMETFWNYIEAELHRDLELKSPRDMVQPILDTLSKGAGGVKVVDTDPEGRKARKEERERQKAKKKRRENGGDTGKDPEKDDATLEELLDELNGLIGLDEVKYDVTSLINLVRIREIREKKGLAMPPISLHLVFSGNPGTGKTTVARLLARIYHKIGVLSTGQLVEVDRAGMVAGYVGQTALKVQDILEKAKGGVLFIDEAYALTPENATNDYGLEAIDTLVKGMEDARDDMIVIAAGYTKPMERFIGANPGLKSRFNKFIEFRDYTADELVMIFARFCRENGYRPSRPALLYVHQYFEKRLEEHAENFANAREARNLFEFSVARQANRIILENDPSEEVLTLIRRDDVAGRSLDAGKQSFLAGNALGELGKKRQGIPEEFMHMLPDELELSARCWHALKEANLRRIDDILDYLDHGHKLTDIEGISGRNAEEIEQGLRSLGWEK